MAEWEARMRKKKLGGGMLGRKDTSTLRILAINSQENLKLCASFRADVYSGIVQ
jgi:hypothetical protein